MGNSENLEARPEGLGQPINLEFSEEEDKALITFSTEPPTFSESIHSQVRVFFDHEGRPVSVHLTEAIEPEDESEFSFLTPEELASKLQRSSRIHRITGGFSAGGAGLIFGTGIARMFYSQQVGPDTGTSLFILGLALFGIGGIYAIASGEDARRIRQELSDR